MRRKDREMPQGFALEVADKCEYATLAMSDGDAPYCVPITIVREGEFVYFHCAQEGKKIDILRRNPKVCIACVGDTEIIESEFTTKYQSAVIHGTAEEVCVPDDKIHALKILCSRHAPTNMHGFDKAIERSLARTGIWRVHIDEITGKSKR